MTGTIPPQLTFFTIHKSVSHFKQICTQCYVRLCIRRKGKLYNPGGSGHIATLPSRYNEGFLYTENY